MLCYGSVSVVSAVLFLLYCHVTPIVSSNPIGSYWEKLENNAGIHFTSEPLGDRWTSDSILDCILSCHIQFKCCQSIMYDDVSGLCTPGGRIAEGHGSISQPSTVSVYYSNDSLICNEETSDPPTCDEDSGFSLKTLGDTTVCLYVSQDALNQIKAKEKCAEMGATLYTPKSLEKFNILTTSALPGSSVWIGLEDVYKNGSFFWADGEYFDPNSSLWTNLWAYTQPTLSNSESCVISFNAGPFHDYPCEQTIWYMCEIL